MNFYRFLPWSPVLILFLAAGAWIVLRRRREPVRFVQVLSTVTAWSVVLGVVGYFSGSVLPGLLDAHPANLQFLVGMFATGPQGVFLGAVLGALVQLIPVRRALGWWSLLGVSVLYACLIVSPVVPHYSFSHHVIEGEIVACQSVDRRLGARWDYWRKEHARVLASDAPVDKANAELNRQRGDDVDWEAEVTAASGTRPGVILSVQLARKATVYQGRWRTGRVVERVSWEPAHSTEEFFFEANAASCEGLSPGRSVRLRGRNEAWDRWPPRNLPAFLGLDVMAIVAE